MNILSNDGRGKYDEYKEKICKCRVCEKLLKNDMRNFIVFESKGYYKITRKDTLNTYRRPKADKETKDACLEHYMACKNREFEDVKKNTLRELIDELKKDRICFQKYNTILETKCEYLGRWAEVMEDLIRK